MYVYVSSTKVHKHVPQYHTYFINIMLEAISTVVSYSVEILHSLNFPHNRNDQKTLSKRSLLNLK